MTKTRSLTNRLTALERMAPPVMIGPVGATYRHLTDQELEEAERFAVLRLAHTGDDASFRAGLTFDDSARLAAITDRIQEGAR